VKLVESGRGGCDNKLKSLKSDTELELKLRSVSIGDPQNAEFGVRPRSQGLEYRTLMHPLRHTGMLGR